MEQSKPYMPKITASSIESFTAISEALLTLPEVIREQIELAETGSIGIHCKIKYVYKCKQKIFLPTTCTQIEDFDTYIGIYCGRFFFTLNDKLYTDVKATYAFIDINKK